MNIRDYWDKLPKEVYRNTPELWNYLLDLRAITYKGFASIEAEKGLLKPVGSLNSAMGQEMARMLLFRILEEMGESHDSIDPDHIKEEAIDAVNYLLSLHAIDPDVVSRERLIPALMSAADDVDRGWHFSLSATDIGETTIDFSRIGDLLRNRAWMNNAQDTYFSGPYQLIRTIQVTMSKLIHTCADFDDFVRFYVTKNDVLMFRLRSNY